MNDYVISIITDSKNIVDELKKKKNEIFHNNRMII